LTLTRHRGVLAWSLLTVATWWRLLVSLLAKSTWSGLLTVLLWGWGGVVGSWLGGTMLAVLVMWRCRVSISSLCWCCTVL